MSEPSYYEAHVTIELDPEERLMAAIPHVTDLSSAKGFKFASLTTSCHGQEKLSHILTGHDKQRGHLLERMVQMIKLLKLHGYSIVRYKIEDISLDSRVIDSYGLLG